MITKIFAHRGDKHNAPENTLIAFQKAIADGVDGIETDVHLTKDGHLVIIHDEDVSRTTDHRGLVKDYTLAELKQMNANPTFPKLGVQRIPTLDELVQLLNQFHFTGALNLEIKTDHIHYPGIEQRVADYFHTHSYGFQLIYSSFNLATTNQMIKLAPDVETAGLMIYHYHALKQLHAQNLIQVYHPEIRVLRLHPLFNRQTNFRPWTVNSKSEIAFCLKRHYMGLITDDPVVALQMRTQIQKEG
ncbi:glycerophosphodiester phosphodiesterase family protein [Nicoliella lavandulae]|uniref:Glycerophosphodiester phosphodiesterase family protein n=1 Tax=Nicoliella lavandulae TaxID=3082954 RepID=A0ABU8SLA5_9LACO